MALAHPLALKALVPLLAASNPGLNGIGHHGPFELRFFRWLFSVGNLVDSTSYPSYFPRDAAARHALAKVAQDYRPYVLSRPRGGTTRAISPASASTSPGLLDGSRACDKAARKLLGQPRGTSVFAAPCRAVLRAETHAEASAVNRQKTGRGLSQQAFRIGFENQAGGRRNYCRLSAVGIRASPEVCFWALNGQRSMAHNKKIKDGVARQLALLSPGLPGNPAASG